MRRILSLILALLPAPALAALPAGTVRRALPAPALPAVTVTRALSAPDGTRPQSGTIRATLGPVAATYSGDGQTTVVSGSVVGTVALGVATITLAPNDVLAPAGTIYAVSVSSDKPRLSWSETWSVASSGAVTRIGVAPGVTLPPTVVYGLDSALSGAACSAPAVASDTGRIYGCSGGKYVAGSLYASAADLSSLTTTVAGKLDSTAQAADSGKLGGYVPTYFAADSAVVHLAGAETITGSKTVTGPLNAARFGIGGTTALAFGDSITYGVGASSPDTTSYRAIVAASRGWTATNGGQSGAELGDLFSDYIYASTVAAGSVSYGLVGYNDMRHNGTDATRLADWERTLTAAAAWLALPEAQKVRGQSAGITYSGAWYNASYYGAGAGLTKYANASTATATATLRGTAIVVGYTQIANGGTATVSVDGVVKATITSALTWTGGNAKSYRPQAIVIGGLAPGAHTVVVAKSGDGLITYIDWLAGLGAAATVDAPLVLLGNCLRMPAAGYSLGGSAWVAGSDAAAALYSAAVARVAATLSAAGLRVRLVDAAASYAPEAGDVSADNVHPSDTGHAKIAAAFIAAAEASSIPAATTLQPTVSRLQPFPAAPFACGPGGVGRTYDLSDYTQSLYAICTCHQTGAATWAWRCASQS